MLAVEFIPSTSNMRTMNRIALKRLCAVTAALHGAFAIAAGAFAAHGAEPSNSELLRTGAWWQTMAALAALYSIWREAVGAALFFVVGAALFAGGLYALAFNAPNWVGAIAPFGGGSLILGWLALAIKEFSNQKQP